MKMFYHFANFIAVIFLIVSCCGRGTRRGSESSATTMNPETQSTTITKETTEEVILKYKVNVYLENSGSMNGFINQNSEFQDAFQSLTALLKHHYEESILSMNYINTEIHRRP